MGDGFNPYANEAILDFSGTRYEGAEIRVRVDVRLKTVLAFPDEAGIAEQWAWLQEHVLSGWNLEGPDGKRLPLSTPAGELPNRLMIRVVNAWIGAVNTVSLPGPLVERSDDTPTSGGQ